MCNGMGITVAGVHHGIKKAAEADKRITFVSGSWDRFLEDAGKPEPKLFIADGLHMSDAGYAIWNELLTPLLKVPVAAP